MLRLIAVRRPPASAGSCCGIVDLLAVCSPVVVIGSLMYVIEGAEHGFPSIPVGMYWATVTLATVGYGDSSPTTPLGQMLAPVVTIPGDGSIAVATGIVTAELTAGARTPAV